MFKSTSLQAIKSAVVATTLALSAFSTQAQAYTLTYTGTLSAANEIRSLSFTLSATSDLTIQGYGLNLFNQTGFDTEIGLYNASGTLVQANDDAILTTVTVPDGTSKFNSGLFISSLAAGTYTLYLGAYNIIWPNSISNTIITTNTTSFSTSAYNGYYIFGVTSDALVTSAVPEPAAALLFASGLLGLVGFRRRKQEA